MSMAAGSPYFDIGDVTDNIETVAPQRWWHLMPIIFIRYTLAYVDRGNYSFNRRHDGTFVAARQIVDNPASIPDRPNTSWIRWTADRRQ